MKYSIKLLLIPHVRKALYVPDDYRGILRKTGAEDYWSFKINDGKGYALLCGKEISSSISFLVGDRPNCFSDDSEFEIFEAGKVIGIGRFYK